MSGAELREKAGRVFDQRHPGASNLERQRISRSIRERQIGHDLPNGPASVLRASWRSNNGGQEDFSVRGWIVDPYGEFVPMTGFGLHLRPEMLPGLAVLIAQALDELEACGGDLRNARATDRSAFQPGRRGR